MDLLVSTEDLSIFGGPTSIDVNVGTGEQGTRGTYIFTGTDRPGDLTASEFLDNVTGFSKSVQPKDLYINLNPSDQEYLYLYQYDQIAGGTYQWNKTLRLVPNTAIANIQVPFYNGKAITYVPDPGMITLAELIPLLDTIVPSPTAPSSPTQDDLWLDLATNPLQLKMYDSSAWVKQGFVYQYQLFPLSLYFDLSQLGTEIDESKFNIQYNVLSASGNPVSSSITVSPTVSSITDGVLLPISVSSIEATINPITSEVTWAPLQGLQTVHLLMTAGV